MIKIHDGLTVSWFDYLYMIVMLIYMGQATPETRCMISGNIFQEFIPIMIPIVLTGILIYFHKIAFDNVNLQKILGLFFIWCLLTAIKYGYGLGSHQAVGLSFFLFYAVFIAYIHIRVFKKNFFCIFEHAMKYMCLLSMLLWILYLVFPGFFSAIFHASSEVTYGNNFLYLYTWMDPSQGQVYYDIPRNAGFSWEPGRFAILICLALSFNILRTNWSWRNNYTLWIFLCTLLTTFSTTGYMIAIIIISLWLLQKKGGGYKFLFFIVLAFSVYTYTSIDFLGDKIDEQTNFQDMMFKVDEQINSSNMLGEEEYFASLDRFSALYFELQNILHDPILGYSQITTNSFFYQNISTNLRLTGGLLKLFGWFGIPLGLILYIILYNSSKKIAYDYGYSGIAGWLVFICMLLASVSYSIYGVPILTTTWYYGIFSKKHEIGRV